MHTVADRVRRTINRLNLIPPGSRVIVALSGGPDSVALVHVLREVSAEGGFVVAALAHLNHGLRGAAADEDEAFCRDIAASLHLPIDVSHRDVPSIASERATSIENAGRWARYRFLAEAAERASADRIAVGHTRDDQAETFLLRLVRGAGPGGFSGIRPRLGAIVRPLIEESRSALMDYLSERGLAFREDETNLDTTVPRNRVRHELIPYLEARFSPGIARVLSREAAVARADAEFLQGLADQASEGITSLAGDSVHVDVAGLRNHPPAIRWRLVRAAIGLVPGAGFVGYDHVASVLEFVDSAGIGAHIDLPGVTGTRSAEGLCLSPKRDGRGRARNRRGAGSPDMERVGTNYFPVSLSIPGEAFFPLAGVRLTAERAEWEAKEFSLPAGLPGWAPGSVVVDAAELASSLGVRARRPGDRFRPLGLDGVKKLQDFFVDRKVPRGERDRVPIVVDDRDRIVWVAGHAIAEDFRVTPATKAVVILRLSRLE
jgi:tRNA(Ile)-lysidine synthase